MKKPAKSHVKPKPHPPGPKPHIQPHHPPHIQPRPPWIHPRPYHNPPPLQDESLRLEMVVVSVGFDDMLDVSLSHNHGHFDTVIVVTSHQDSATRAVAHKHGAICVPTDLFSKNGRSFNKGAAINAGFNYFQYHGWRMHLDADIILPHSFRRVLFNHSHIEKDWIYGCDRVDVVSHAKLKQVMEGRQHGHDAFVSAPHGPLSPRFMNRLHGYIPLGYFQLWHASCQKAYPYSLGTAAHDDIMFSTLWPKHRRQLLPSIITHHLCARPPSLGENWDGKRRQPRLDT